LLLAPDHKADAGLVPVEIARDVGLPLVKRPEPFLQEPVVAGLCHPQKIPAGGQRVVSLA
jgi:hypothetical protein